MAAQTDNDGIPKVTQLEPNPSSRERISPLFCPRCSFIAALTWTSKSYLASRQETSCWSANYAPSWTLRQYHVLHWKSHQGTLPIFPSIPFRWLATSLSHSWTAMFAYAVHGKRPWVCGSVGSQRRTSLRRNHDSLVSSLDHIVLASSMTSACSTDMEQTSPTSYLLSSDLCKKPYGNDLKTVLATHWLHFENFQVPCIYLDP